MSLRKKKFPLLLIALTITGAVSTYFANAAEEDDAPTSRPAPRALLSKEQYAQRAAELRDLYAKPREQWPAATIDPSVKYEELGPVPKPIFPESNPFSKEKAELGQMLFFDVRLSGSGQIACVTCHESELGFSDGKATSFGHGRSPLKRNAPGLVNASLRKSFFWDGRAETLEKQALEPILASDEMNANEKVMLERLNAIPGYREKFKAIFGVDEITSETIAKALATFQRTLTSRTSDFDRFLSGKSDALNDSAIRGLHLFRTEAHCANCHMGPTFSDEKFHNLGLSYYGRKLEDLGRYNVTKEPKDVGAFKTPTLRNVTRNAPYMHNGLFDLDGVLRMYNAGMATLRRKPEQKDDPLFPTKSHLLKPLGFNKQDLEDLKSFLSSLEEARFRLRPPELPADPQPSPKQ